MHRVFFWLSSFSVTAAFENEFLLPTQTDQSSRGDGRRRGGPTSARGSMAGGRAAGGPPLWDHVAWRKKPWTLSPLTTPGIWRPPPSSSVRSGRDRRVWHDEKAQRKRRRRRRRRDDGDTKGWGWQPAAASRVWTSGKDWALNLDWGVERGGGVRALWHLNRGRGHRQTLHGSKQDKCLFTGHCWQPQVAKQIRNHRQTQTSADDGKQNQWSSSSHWQGFRRFR